MTWAPPPKGQQNGELVSYEVEYREEGSNSTVVNTTRGMTHTAEDLTPDRAYQFRVAANTVNGTGPFSKLISITTIPTGNERVAIDIVCVCVSVCLQHLAQQMGLVARPCTVAHPINSLVQDWFRDQVAAAATVLYIRLWYIYNYVSVQVCDCACICANIYTYTHQKKLHSFVM